MRHQASFELLLVFLNASLLSLLGIFDLLTILGLWVVSVYPTFYLGLVFLNFSLVAWMVSCANESTAELQRYREELGVISQMCGRKIHEQDKKEAENSAWVKLLSSLAGEQGQLEHALTELRRSAENLALSTSGEQQALINRHCELIVHASERCLNTIQRYREYYRQPIVKFGPIDLRKLLQTVIQEQTAFRDKIILNVNGETTLRGDAELLKQCMRELLKNAIQAYALSENSKKIFVDAQFDWVRRQWLIEVRDFSKNYIPHQLPPAHALEDLMRPMYSSRTYGLGIGLSLVQRNASLMNGRLSLNQHTDGFSARLIIEVSPIKPPARDDLEKIVDQMVKNISLTKYR